jgi:hypothetical protein
VTRSRLTATEILHGARAYSSNASRRAHQLSGPKRVRVMHGPIDDASGNVEPPADAEANWEAACDGCGYLQCSKHGPCAPQVTPKPSARALDNLGGEPARVWRVGDRVRVVGAPFDGRAGAVSHVTRFATVVVHLDGPKEGTQEYYHSADGTDLVAEPSPAGGRFKVGDRVRVKDADLSELRHAVVGRIATVTRASGPEKPYRYEARVDGNDSWAAMSPWGFREHDIEPAPIAEAPVVESDEEVLRRCGWSGRPGASFLDYYLADGTALWVSPLGASPSWFRSGGDGETHNAPTLLQAACAALSIELVGRNGVGFVAVVGGQDVCGADAESCARAALLAYASRGKP